MDAITIKDLSFSYPKTKSSPERLVLHELSFSVPQGDIFGLLGPNGGGKSTLFKILTTLMRPSLGTAFVGGINVMENPTGVRKSIGVVFQNPSLDKKLSLRENMTHQGHLYGLSTSEIRTRMKSLSAQLSIDSRMDDWVELLSGGLQRRGEIAKGLLHNPPVLLMDEPSTGLDPSARREMWEVLQNLKKNGMTVLLTTHLMEDADRCDRLAILHKGRCVALGAPEQLKRSIGGDVISIETASAYELSIKIHERFSVESRTIDNSVRIEIKEGHTFIPKVVEAFPGLISSITVGKPTLEDVFIHETGEHI